MPWTEQRQQRGALLAMKQQPTPWPLRLHPRVPLLSPSCLGLWEGGCVTSRRGGKKSGPGAWMSLLCGCEPDMDRGPTQGWP